MTVVFSLAPAESTTRNLLVDILVLEQVPVSEDEILRINIKGGWWCPRWVYLPPTLLFWFFFWCSCAVYSVQITNYYIYENKLVQNTAIPESIPGMALIQRFRPIPDPGIDGIDFRNSLY